MNATTSRPCPHVDDQELEATRAERRTRWVVGITALMMVAELVVGTLTKSLALVADGWHMATHAGALGLAALAYWYARTRARAATFTFGTGKVHALTGFTNAVVLLLVAIAMMTEGVTRLVHPEKVKFDEAIPVAIVGLLVNIVCFFLLHPGGHDHSHDHGHGHAHPHEEHDHDLNLKAAYVHVAADALTSILAIGALLGGRYFGWVFLDPAMAIFGSLVILKWGVGLVGQSGRQLLDVAPSPELEVKIRAAIESLGGGAEVHDLHVWDMGQGRRGCILSVVTSKPLPLEDYRAAVLAIAPIDHLTVEIDHIVEASRAAF